MNFCTYFDSAYITKAIVCRHTLLKQTPARLFVLCFDKISEDIVNKWPEAMVIRLTDIEMYNKSLLSVKNKRLLKEYYATITPTLPLYIFDRFGINTLFYTDSDMAFWSPAEEIEEAMEGQSLLVTPHENPIAIAGGSGYFNVGILGYRNDVNCREFLEWWRDRCLEWCEWRALPDGRMADQGYLTILQDQPNKFQGVLSKPQPGINLGPWNLSMHQTEFQNEQIILDGKHNLVCYHYHGYKNVNGQCCNDTGWTVSPWNLEHIYQPYHKLILKAQAGELG